MLSNILLYLLFLEKYHGSKYDDIDCKFELVHAFSYFSQIKHKMYAICESFVLAVVVVYLGVS